MLCARDATAHHALVWSLLGLVKVKQVLLEVESTVAVDKWSSQKPQHEIERGKNRCLLVVARNEYIAFEVALEGGA
ncbi:hypothetical protein J1N35_013906 [Gossypium stocksii]|uniref:Uncharacterized protein n=1 Tax=Gossypium stocksii TaxID=47602 RepID=A0A9D3VT78_9ROSI|nr:hypothetical protein J1N35_013906 [Gossypium stocksii]